MKRNTRTRRLVVITCVHKIHRPFLVETPPVLTAVRVPSAPKKLALPSDSGGLPPAA